VLVVALLLAGRAVRHHLLIGPDGRWRDDLWLAAAVAAAPAPAQAAPERPVLTTPLPINTCGEDSLTLLPRVGPVLAARIAAARREGLVFRSGADLQRVKGIGPAMAARLETLVVFQAPAEADSQDALPP
jgi:competence protein ComEA